MLMTTVFSKKWIFAVDAIHNELHFTDHNYIENTWNLEKHIESMNRLEKYQKSCNGRLIFGHDVDQWSQLKTLPEYYD